MEKKYYHTKESVKEYIRLADGIDGSELIEKLQQYTSKNSSILEIGSGPGSDWEILSKNYSVTGSDNSAEFIKRLTAKYPDGEFLELDAVTLLTEKKFDVIYSNKVMHHLTDTELIDSIKRQYEILNTNGIICHSFWKGESSEVFKGMLVNCQETENLKEFFGNHFDILLLESYKEFEDNDSLLLIGRKK